MLNAFRLTDKELGLISELVYRKFGIKLDERKRALIIGRLQKILRQKGFSTFEQYYDYVNSDPSGQALITLIDRISTNHTFFYREQDHFDFFRSTVIPQMVEFLGRRKRKDLRIWCPGCSSGEEPYTLAMLLLDAFGAEIERWDPGILATDVAIGPLEKAIAGVYSDENVSHLPKPFRLKYFAKLKDGNWEVKERVKKLVLFRRLNLMRSDFPFKGKFQVIFCRNVMIYFDKPTRDILVRKYARYTEPGGYLFIGHSESLGRSNLSYRYIRPAVYRKVSNDG